MSLRNAIVHPAHCSPSCLNSYLHYYPHNSIPNPSVYIVWQQTKQIKCWDVHTTVNFASAGAVAGIVLSVIALTIVVGVVFIIAGIIKWRSKRILYTPVNVSWNSMVMHVTVSSQCHLFFCELMAETRFFVHIWFWWEMITHPVVCHIDMKITCIQLPERWGTLIHECMHRNLQQCFTVRYLPLWGCTLHYLWFIHNSAFNLMYDNVMYRGSEGTSH